MGICFSVNSTFFEEDDMWVEYDPSFGFVIGEYDRIVYLTARNMNVQFDGSYKIRVLKRDTDDIQLHIVHRNDVIYACSIWKDNVCIDLYTTCTNNWNHEKETNENYNFWNYIPNFTFVTEMYKKIFEGSNKNKKESPD